MPSCRYLHYDVFTDRPFAGNQLAVFPEANGLDTDTMQRIANEMNFSETTFILPAESSETDVRMRIFTPTAEMPMAGHPTIGSTFALAHEDRIASSAGEFTFGLGVGPTPVQLKWNGNQLAFAWMVQARPAFGVVLSDLTRLAAALGVEEHDLRETGLQPQLVSTGVEFLIVPLATRAAVDAAVLNRPAIQEIFGAAGIPEVCVFIFSPEKADDDADAYSRMFAPALGVPEDPATGSATGPLGAYLLQHGVVSPKRARQLVSLQGVRVGRPSRLCISLTTTSDGIAAVKVGGRAVLVGEGTLRF